jgi:hypothetical protein
VPENIHLERMSKSSWRIQAENLIKEGKSNLEIVNDLGNPYSSIKNYTSRITKIRREIKAFGNIPEEAKTYLQKKTEEVNIPIESVRQFWYKDKHISINATNDRSLEEVLFEVMKEMKEYSPQYPTLNRRSVSSGNCLVIDPADIHIGKLARVYETGEEYNMEIAVKRVRDGVKTLLDYTHTFGIEKVVLVIGNDVLHTDGKRRTTTSGTPQDTDGMWYDNFNVARALYVEIIEMLITVANVHVVHNMSNHDNVIGWALAQTIEAWFSKCPHVTFDVSPNPRKAFLWHDNLIAFTHGEVREDKLALLLPHDFPKEWAASKFRNIYKGHIHHKTSKDHMSITIETSRSSSAADSWHNGSGYVYSPQAVECYLHGKGKGQFGRFSHYL